MAKGKGDVTMDLQPNDGFVTVEATRDYCERGLRLGKGMRAVLPIARVKEILKEHDFPTYEIDEKTGYPVVVKGKDGKRDLVERRSESPIVVVEASDEERKELRQYSNRMMKVRDKKALKEAKESEELSRYARTRGDEGSL